MNTTAVKLLEAYLSYPAGALVELPSHQAGVLMDRGAATLPPEGPQSPDPAEPKPEPRTKPKARK